MENKGRFSASGVSKLCAEGTGATRLGYIYEIALGLVDCKPDITTSAMYHGINNEATALDILIQEKGGQHNFNFETGRQQSFKVNDYLSATPDAYEEGIWTGDAKCQYSIKGFLEQNSKISKAYNYQVQTQMLALKVDKAYLINYLTKPEKFGQDDWTEYPFPLEDRFYIHEISKDEAICEEILTKAEQYHPMINIAYQQIANATILDEMEFFYNQLKNGVYYKSLKDYWVNNESEVFRFDNEFYITKK
jgi:hypothetical protein